MKTNRNVMIKAIILSIVLITAFFFASCSSSAYTNYGWTGSVVDDGTIYVASPGKLAALQQDNGNVKWERELKDEATSSGLLSCGMAAQAPVMYADPVVVDGMVYVATYSGKIYAYETVSGNLKWEYPSDGYVKGIIGGMIVDNGVMYFAAVGGVVTALDINTQGVIWQYDTEDTLWASPCLNDDTLYIASYDKKLYAIDVASGDLKWEDPFTANGPIVATPIYDNGVIYIGSLDRGIYAVDAASGSLIWEFSSYSDTENTPKNWFWATPLIIDGVIYAPNMDGFVYILDLSDGTLIKSLELGKAVSSDPVYYEDKVFLSTQDGDIYYISTDNNSKYLLKSLELTVQSSLCIDDGIIYVHTIKTENLYAINSNSGVVVWYYEVG